MNKQLQEFFHDEVIRGHLVFESDTEYNDLFSQSEALFSDGDLPREIGKLLDISNCISFAHGLKLGLRLERWAGDQSQIAVAK